MGTRYEYNVNESYIPEVIIHEDKTSNLKLTIEGSVYLLNKYAQYLEIIGKTNDFNRFVDIMMKENNNEI